MEAEAQHQIDDKGLAGTARTYSLHGWWSEKGTNTLVFAVIIT